MNKKTFTKSLFVLAMAMIFSVTAFAQQDHVFSQQSQNEWKDNPMFDHVPPIYYNSINYELNPEAVITINDYDNFDLGVDFAEPHQSINPLNPVQFLNAWNINNTHYTQNGFDWATLAPSFGVSVQGDPVTAYDSLGNLFYESMFGSITGCKVIRSTNNGQTWSAGVTAISGNDKNWIACDQTAGPYANYVYTVMTPGNFARSTDHGATFQTTGTSGTFGGTQTLPGMMVAVGANGSISGGCVYVVTHSGSNGAGRYTFFRSTDGGATFQQRSQHFFSNYIGTEIGGRSTVNGMRTRPYPMIAADNSYGPYRGRLYLVYASNFPAGSGNKPDIFLRYSDDQAATWSNAVTVNDDPNTAANHQFFPAIWCDKQTGRLFIKFYDSRLCPTSDSMDVYATYTDDGGATFAPNQRISNKTFKTKLASSGTPPAYQGDYDAIAGINNQSLLVWTDFRNNNYGSYVGYFPDFAMRSDSGMTVGTEGDSAYFRVRVPSVKLYTNTATFTTELTPAPAAGQILITPVGSNILTTYPDSVQFKVKTVGSVPQGAYTITITGKGPNGTPVHKRSFALTIGPPIPVELTSFAASVTDFEVKLNWITATELNNKGFEIERTVNTAGTWQNIGFVEGHGSTTEMNTYSYSDKNIIESGVYFYRLKQLDYDGQFAYSNVVEVDVTKPLNFNLSQNYPNPFNPVTNIKYSIPSVSKVTLKVYDVLGNEVSTLVNEVKNAGSYDVQFDASSLSSGIYFYTIQADNFTSTKKLTLMK
jgi:hypothetical protein